MNSIVKFEFEGREVRLANADPDAPEWVAKDVCEALGIDATSGHALDGLDEDEKGRCSIPTLGGPQDMATVNEPGLYALIAKSRKPAAKRFRRFVNHEILPSIRRTGGYVEPGREVEFMRALQEQGRLMLALTTEVKALREWKDCREREHPYGLMGPRDAKVLAGQMHEIRDLMIRGGDERKPRAVLLIVDRSIRLQSAYPKDKGAKWEHATAQQATIAFSRASQWIAALRRDAPKPPPATSQVHLGFVAQKN